MRDEFVIASETSCFSVVFISVAFGLSLTLTDGKSVFVETMSHFLSYAPVLVYRKFSV